MKYKKNVMPRFIVFLFFLLCFYNGSAQNDSDKVVLILGNSITFHEPKPSLGWYGNWGMAASAKNKDYVSLLKYDIKAINPNTKLKIGNVVSSFERRFWNFDTLRFSKFRSMNPEILILNIGENIPDSVALNYPLKQSITSLVNYITNNRQIPVFLVGSFWDNHKTSALMKEVCDEKGYVFISLDGLYKNPENTAINEFKNKRVGRHPSDLGMKNIAERIWTAIKGDITKL